jgi:hypothetical protein
MTRALSTHDADEKFIQSFSQKMRRDYLDRLENNIKMDLIETEYGVE